MRLPSLKSSPGREPGVVNAAGEVDINVGQVEGQPQASQSATIGPRASRGLWKSYTVASRQN